MASSNPNVADFVKLDVECPHGCVENGLAPPFDVPVGEDFDAQIVAIIEEAVQNPPPGAFGPGDVNWALERRPPRGKHRRRHVVQHCYVPTSRVDNFIAGMQNGKDGAQCTFRRSPEDRRWDKDKKEGPRAALHTCRYVALYFR